jgi:uncharacterized membrane protein
VALWTLAAVTTLWVGLVMTAPVSPPWIAAFVYAVSSLVCHQLPERSFYWGDSQFAVCARCVGIYGGGVAGAVLAAAAGTDRLMRLAPWVRKLLIAGAVPTLATVVAEWIGIWQPTHAMRLLAGIPLGLSGIATLCVATAMTTLHYGRWPHRSPDRQPAPPLT